MEPLAETTPTDGLIARRNAPLLVHDRVADVPGAMDEGDASNCATGNARGPKTGSGAPRSNAPRSGFAPVKLPLLMFGRNAPASTAGQPACSVITCGGTGAGG